VGDEEHLSPGGHASPGRQPQRFVPDRLLRRAQLAGGREVERREVELPRFGHTHIALEAEVGDGRVEVEVISRDGAAMVVPYVSMVDGRTGLSTHILPDAMPSHAVPAGWAPPLPEAGAPLPGAR